MVKKRFKVEGMHCSGCVIAVEGAVEDLPGVKSAHANYARQFADIEYDENKVTPAQIIAQIKLAGYSASLSET